MNNYLFPVPGPSKLDCMNLFVPDIDHPAADTPRHSVIHHPLTTMDSAAHVLLPLLVSITDGLVDAAV